MKEYEKPKLFRIEKLASQASSSLLFNPLGGIEFLEAPPLRRSAMVAKYLSENSFTRQEYDNNEAFNTGLVVIKPEAQPIKRVLMKMIQNLAGVKILQIRDTKYDLDSFMVVYGNFLRREDMEVGLTIPALLFAGYVGTITAIQFAYPNISAYFDRDDPQSLFKKLFIGTGEPQTGTVRAEIRPYLQTLGFGRFDTHFAKSFDITGELRHRNPEQNLRTFNGIHCPSDLGESRRQTQIYFGSN